MNIDKISQVIERLKEADGPDRALDCRILEALGYEFERNIWRKADDVLVEHTARTFFTASIDSALSLGKEVTWLAPILDYSNMSARLVNGIGLPVGGTDHLSTANTMPVALCIAYLKAIMKKESYND